MNKKVILGLIFSCLIIFQHNLFAQENNEAKTLFGGNLSTKDLGFFYSTLLKFYDILG